MVDGGWVQDIFVIWISVFWGSVLMGGNSMGEVIFIFDEQFVFGCWDEGELIYFLELFWCFVFGVDWELYVIYEE